MRVRCHLAIAFFAAAPLQAATVQQRYYAHPAVHDASGVIAPWYTGQNGQMDWRVRIAAETLKRYPWTDTKKAVAALPEFIFSGAWKIAADGTITIPPINDWANGDLGQRAAYVLSALIDYYRYTGDATALSFITLQADALLDYCLTPPDHPWPNFLISVPVKGKPYGKCDPHGFIQLDIVAEAGLPLLRAARMTGNTRWLEAARHWGDLLAEKRNRAPGVPPWARYANPQDAPWDDLQTGGMVFILEFFDELLRSGYTGHGADIREARTAGVEYLRDVLLPRWTVNDVWGRNYWDWPDPVQAENVTEFAVRYLMAHPEDFPGWRTDARNVLSLFINHTGVSPGSRGDVYSGAWAYPESSGCCGRSLWYGPFELGPVFLQYGVLADSDWGRELGRRQMILATYDAHETGVVEDNIDGGAIVAGDWFKIAHPMALKYALAAIAWQPEVFAPARENHIVRSSAVIASVTYGKGRIAYTTVDAPPNTVDVLRLAFRPRMVQFSARPRAAGEPAPQVDTHSNGYQVKELPGGDYFVAIRHDGNENVELEGDDPQEETAANVGATWSFRGNQVRVLGSVAPDGGLADVFLDNVKQLVHIDCWGPQPRERQVLYYRNGLANGQHILRVVARGQGNPKSSGTAVLVTGMQFSVATPQSASASAPTTPPANPGQGGGPRETQRVIFGYAERTDYIDSAGNAWRPATEWVIRAGNLADSVASAWWTQRTRLEIAGTRDPELYRYGAHSREFWADFTVAPGTYHAILKFAETRNIEPRARAITIQINGREVARNVDLAATASGEARRLQRTGDHYPVWGGLNSAVDLVFNNIQPANGVISIRFAGSFGGEAIVQAIEVGPGEAPGGAAPVSVPEPPASQPATRHAR